MTRKERGATPCEVTPHGTTAQADITTPVREVEVPRGAYHPLTWRGADPQQQDGDGACRNSGTPQLADQARKAQKPFRGKAKRNARRAALQAKRHQAGISTFDILAHLAFGAWLATVLLWAWEALQ